MGYSHEFRKAPYKITIALFRAMRKRKMHKTFMHLRRRALLPLHWLMQTLKIASYIMDATLGPPEKKIPERQEDFAEGVRKWEALSFEGVNCEGEREKAL